VQTGRDFKMNKELSSSFKEKHYPGVRKEGYY